MNPCCPYCPKDADRPSESVRVVRNGEYFRTSDYQLINRYKCMGCCRSFSDATDSRCFNQKKRDLNAPLSNFLCSGVSQRRLAFLYGISRTTVARKLEFVGTHLKLAFDRIAESCRDKVVHLQFDDLETFEHTKLKPISITMAVEAGTRKILGFEVSSMPAKGKLAKKSLEKYGRREDGRKAARLKLLRKIAPLVSETALIQTDKNPHYPADVKKVFPRAQHKTTKGRRGCVTGQGELKAEGFDPLFSLNHTYASVRANVNRLFRRTWCTTKNMARLEMHLAMYAAFHNTYLT